MDGTRIFTVDGWGFWKKKPIASAWVITIPSAEKSGPDVVVLLSASFWNKMKRGTRGVLVLAPHLLVSLFSIILCISWVLVLSSELYLEDMVLFKNWGGRVRMSSHSQHVCFFQHALVVVVHFFSCYFLCCMSNENWTMMCNDRCFVLWYSGVCASYDLVNNMIWATRWRVFLF